MPAGPPLPDRRGPTRLAHTGALPEGKVAHIVLAVLIRLDALADSLSVRIEPRQAPVARPRRDPEEDGAIVGAVGVALLEQRADEPRHLGDVRRRARHLVGDGDAEPTHVVDEGGRVSLGKLGDADALGSGVPDDLVIHVGDVHDPGDRVTLPGEVAAQQVGEDEAPEVADVRRRVDRGTTAVDTHVARFQRLEGLEGAT